MNDTPTTVNVRWWDGYREVFKCTEVRFGAYLLWMRLLNGKNRHIPLSQVRWFSLSEEDHEQSGRVVKATPPSGEGTSRG